MCGIFCIISKNQEDIDQNEEFELCREALRRRGPDAFKDLRLPLTHEWSAFFASSVLWTQGSQISIQPLDNGNVLIFNGDIYSGLDYDVEERWDPVLSNNAEFLSDTERLFSALQDSLEECEDVVAELCGPYTFIYWNAIEKKLYFGRDLIGRHSLLWKVTPDKIVITSVGNSDIEELEEVPCCGLYEIDFMDSDIDIKLHPWAHIEELTPYFIESKVTVTKKTSILHCIFPSEDCSWLGRPPNKSDLEIIQGFRQMKLENAMESLCSNSEFSKKIERLKSYLYKSVILRVQTKPEYCRDCIKYEDCIDNCEHPKIGVLFSGGLDSTILALAADKFIPRNEAIDLYNVAFQRYDEDSFEVPDRITGIKSFEELSMLSPQRKWNFIEINVTCVELNKLREEKIHNLIHPLKTILDDSLGCALWFAARGKGLLNGRKYSSPARIVLLGMGADEMFGGYSRHRQIFRKDGWVALGQELHRELMCIGRRNLGRDNRVVADHGKQPRTPFLDEHLINYVGQLAPWHRCWLMPEFPPGFGDKLLLRLLAWNMGLRKVATFPKRALQFGSRIANPREKGHENSHRLK